MILYLLLTSLLIPVNLWASITPHVHSELSMRALHAVSVVLLLPLLISIWSDRSSIRSVPAVVLAIFLCVMVVVNVEIATKGMPVEFGWIDHLFLALAALSVEAYYLLEPNATTPLPNPVVDQTD